MGPWQGPSNLETLSLWRGGLIKNERKPRDYDVPDTVVRTNP